MIDDWFQLYPGVKSDIERRRAEGRRLGTVRDWGGRLTYHAGLRSTLPWMKSRAERQAYNAVIQGGAQAYLKKAMANIWNDILPLMWDTGYHIEPLLQIHDELIFEMDIDARPAAEALIGPAMCNAGKLKVPVESSCSFSRSWGGLK